MPSCMFGVSGISLNPIATLSAYGTKCRLPLSSKDAKSDRHVLDGSFLVLGVSKIKKHDWSKSSSEHRLTWKVNALTGYGRSSEHDVNQRFRINDFFRSPRYRDIEILSPAG